MLHGACNSVVLFALWVLYTSIVNVAAPSTPSVGRLCFSKLVSAPRHACSSLAPISRVLHAPLVVWAMRLLLFRVMIGAGLIKIRGPVLAGPDVQHHYETQPLPNPLSFWLHGRPVGGTLGDCHEPRRELVAPLAACPEGFPCKGAAGRPQAALILSGNLSFLNYPTIAPAIMCFDDEFLLPIVSRGPSWASGRRPGEARASVPV